MKIINKLADTIKKSRNIVLLGHVGPDGDTLGSMLALKEMLPQINPEINKTDVVIVGRIPDIYRYLPHVNLIKNPDDPELYESYDLAVTVDCASIERLGDSQYLFKNAKVRANIDHHISNTNFADINWIMPHASASGQVLFDFAKHLNINLTKSMAINLYTAILTDTGGFKFGNTKPETLQTCAELIRKGADPMFIYKECYESKPLAMLKLQAKAVDQANFIENNQIAYACITRKLLESLGASDDHVDGISETLRQVNTVKIAFVLKENGKGGTKISFRSNGPDVCAIASFFGGGGHKLAAGCTIEKSIPDSVNELLPLIKKAVKKY